jgi:GNAT superfamily N-acetyltransferase
MYTLPEYRKMGVASSIVKEAIKWSRDNGFGRISLHASSQGKSVYEKFGFQQTNEMLLKLS